MGIGASLHGPGTEEPEKSCQFCDIVRGRAPVRVVGDTAHTLAFFPLNPATRGHTLLIPKRHVPDLWGLDSETALQLASAVLPIAKAIREALNPDGFNVINSSGKAASQTVFHLHVHLVPRWYEDHIGIFWPPAEQWAPDDEDMALESIKEALERSNRPS